MMIHDYLQLFIYDTSKTYILFQMTLNSFIHSYIYSTKYLGQKKMYSLSLETEVT